MATSKNRDLKMSQRSTKIARISERRDLHEAMLAEHDRTCGHMRDGNKPVSRVELYQKQVSIS